MHRRQPVDCRKIRRTALMTVEGELDDICGLGQTEAAHDLCSNIPAADHYHYVQPGVGHYGVFNGTRWRPELQPRVREMIRTTDSKPRPGVSRQRRYTPCPHGAWPLLDSHPTVSPPQTPGPPKLQPYPPPLSP